MLQRLRRRGQCTAPIVFSICTAAAACSRWPLADRGVRVTGVEENRQAIADAEVNARLNRIPARRARFIAARVEDAVRQVAREPWDAVILDPPRQGCADDVLEAVFQEMAPPASPTYRATRTRSLPNCLGSSRAVRVDEVRAVDMFPHTDHVEVVVRLATNLRAPSTMFPPTERSEAVVQMTRR